MTAYYHLRQHISYLGQALVNSYYYVVGIDVPGGLPGIEHAAGVVDAFYAANWTGIYVPGVRAPVRPSVPADALLTKLTCAPIADNFQWEYETPFVQNYSEAGTSGVTSHFPPEGYAKLNFNLEPVPVGLFANPFTVPPKRAHVKFGPVARTSVNEDGTFTTEAMDYFTDVAQYQASNILSALTTAIYYPVRATHRTVKDPLLGTVLYSGYSNWVGVSSGTPTNELFWLRSRDASE